jgi:L-alanine-DL-glutamate epimerase-like enolase superfamily enzyme
MKIKSVEAIPLQIPFSHGGPPAGWGGREWNKLDFVLVRVETMSGIVGFGEAFSYNCRRAVVAMIEDMIAPLAIGQDATNIAELMKHIQLEMHLWGRYGISTFAQSGLDLALWDIAGKAAGLPISRLMGGGKDKVVAYASLFKYQDAEVVAERTRDALNKGYRYIKLHEVAEPEVKSARETMGEGMPLMLDVNCVWSIEEARHIVPRLAAYDLHWLEEPIWPPENFSGLADLRARHSVPVAAGENACTAWQFQAMFEEAAVDYAQPSVTKVGGITEFRKVMALAETNNVTLAPHSPYFGPGYLASAQLVAAMPGDVPFERLYLDLEASLYGDLINPVDGYQTVPQGPGLGMDPDPDVIRDFRVDG